MPRFKLSTQDKNSYNYFVLTSGINLEYFKQNPVMLLNHDRDMILGKWNNVAVEGTQLMADTEFDQEDPEAKIYDNKCEKGYLNGVSIGIEPVEVMLGIPGFGADDLVVTKSILREASLTPVPANKGAVKLMNSSGEEIDQKDLIKLCENKPNTKTMNKLLLTAIALLSLPADSTEEKVIEALTKAMNDSKKLSTDLSAANTDLEALKKQVGDMKDGRIAELVDNAIAANKINKADRETYLSLAKADFDNAKKVIDGLNPHTTLSSQVQNGGTATTDKYKDWDFRKLQADAPEELARIKKDEPERFQELLKGLNRA